MGSLMGSRIGRHVAPSSSRTRPHAHFRHVSGKNLVGSLQTGGNRFCRVRSRVCNAGLDPCANSPRTDLPAIDRTARTTHQSRRRFFMAITEIDAPTLKAWLSDGREIALLDVREAGQFGEGHPFFAVPLPYSRLELGLADLVPNPNVRLVLTDGGDGTAARAAQRAEEAGYCNLHILKGGADGWRRAGYTLYAGVNVPSKTFGELIEHRRQTPCVTAAELQAMRESGENMVIVDGRPFA